MKGRFALFALLLLAPLSLAQEGDAMTGDGTDGNGTADPINSQFLKRWDNPLPAPLDGDAGTFLLEVAAYAAIAAILMLGIGPVLKRAAVRIPGNIDDHIVAILRRPGFFLLFVIGVKDALRLVHLEGRLQFVVDAAWTAILVVAATYVILRLWNEVILSIGKKVSEQSESELDDKLYPFFAKVGGVVIVIAGFFFLLSAFGINLAVFAAGGAVLSLVVAFAAQDTLGNFFSGVFILLDQPFREGDRIELPEFATWGDVKEIGLRTTRIRTQDNRFIIFPNSIIGGNPVINHSFPDAAHRIGVDLGVAYGTDIEHARKVMIEAMKTIEGTIPTRRYEALFLKHGDSSLEFHCRAFFIHYVDKRRYEDKLNTVLHTALAENGIQIPFPQRVVHLKQE